MDAGSADAGAPDLARRSCRRGRIEVNDLVQICHGSPFDEDAYLFDELDAARALRASSRPLCLFGHTHCPGDVRALARRSRQRGAVSRERGCICVDGSKHLVNPGAVGQPRDGDPRAAYAIVDDDARLVDLFRVRYAVGEAQAKIIKAGLPEVLAQRLAVGR